MDKLTDQISIKGGPRTPGGKARSRGNALKHGMAARTLIQSLVGECRASEQEKSLFEELKPSTPVEQMLVKSMASDSLLMDLSAAQTRAVCREVARCLEEIHPDGTPKDDAVLKTLTESPVLALALRYQAGAFARFMRSLQALYLIREQREFLPHSVRTITTEAQAGTQPKNLEKLRLVFSDEESTQRWLLAAMAANRFPVPAEPSSEQTSQSVGTSLEIARLEIALEGTFLAGTKLPRRLLLTIAAEIHADPNAPIAALRLRTGIHRRQTIIKVCRRIHRDGEAPRDWVLRTLYAQLEPPT